MELSQVWRVILRRWTVCALVLGLSIVGALYLAYSPPDRYQATATVLVEPSDVSGVGNFAAVAFLLPSLQVQLTTATIADAAAGRVPASLRDRPAGVSSNVEQGTGVLRITTAGTDPRALAPWANAYASALIASQPSDGPLRLVAIDPATTPGGPSGPNRASTLLSGVVLGLILAVALALALEWLARHRYLRGEIRDRLGVPVLGEIPRMRRTGRTVSAPGILSGSDSYLVETFMRARTSIELQLAIRHVTSICVTSLGSGEGKSTITGTLGWALAAAGHEVTLVEADVRQPTLRQLVAPPGSQTVPAELGTRVTGVADGGGPSLVLVDAADLVSLAESERPAQRRVMHPAEVVSLALSHALGVVDKPAAIVLVDAPPLLRAAEASLASRSVSGVVVVVDVSRRQVLDRVEAALARVEDAGGTVLGVVLNRARRRREEEAEYAVIPAAQATKPAGPTGPPGPAGPAAPSRQSGAQPVNSTD
ncbi:MAG: P-loop NTPase [Frankiaceae bacterium]